MCGIAGPAIPHLPRYPVNSELFSATGDVESPGEP